MFVILGRGRGKIGVSDGTIGLEALVLNSSLKGQGFNRLLCCPRLLYRFRIFVDGLYSARKTTKIDPDYYSFLELSVLTQNGGTP